MRHLRRAIELLATVAVFGGCAETSSVDDCDKLRPQLGERQGISIDDPVACREMLAFFEGPHSEPWESPEAWFSDAYGQSIRFQFQTLEGIARGRWSGTSLGPEPASLPCGGAPVSDAAWNTGGLRALGVERPEVMYFVVTLEQLEAADGRVRVHYRAESDFDCDGVKGVSDVEGWQTLGRIPYAGGWELLRATRTGALTE